MLWTNSQGKSRCVPVAQCISISRRERERESCGCDFGLGKLCGLCGLVEGSRKLVGKMTVLRGAVRRLGPTCGLTGWLAGRWLGDWEAGRRKTGSGGGRSRGGGLDCCLALDRPGKANRRARHLHTSGYQPPGAQPQITKTKRCDDGLVLYELRT